MVEATCDVCLVDKSKNHFKITKWQKNRQKKWEEIDLKDVGDQDKRKLI